MLCGGELFGGDGGEVVPGDEAWEEGGDKAVVVWDDADGVAVLAGVGGGEGAEEEVVGVFGLFLVLHGDGCAGGHLAEGVEWAVVELDLHFVGCEFAEVDVGGYADEGADGDVAGGVELAGDVLDLDLVPAVAVSVGVVGEALGGLEFVGVESCGEGVGGDVAAGGVVAEHAVCVEAWGVGLDAAFHACDPLAWEVGLVAVVELGDDLALEGLVECAAFDVVHGVALGVVVAFATADAEA